TPQRRVRLLPLGVQPYGPRTRARLRHSPVHGLSPALTRTGRRRRERQRRPVLSRLRSVTDPPRGGWSHRGPAIVLGPAVLLDQRRGGRGIDLPPLEEIVDLVIAETQ